MTAEDTLARLAHNRSLYPGRVEAVERDLDLIREQRLGVYTAEIRADILRAYAEGASIAAIKRAYGTKDYRTIAKILASGEAEVEQIKTALNEPAPRWFEVITWNDQVRLTIFSVEGNVVFEATDLNESEYLLIPYDIDANPDLARYYDGKILTPLSTGEEAELHAALAEEFG